jgi:amino acid transporter
VNLFWGLLMVVGTTVLTVAAMLLVRRRAPEGSYFTDGDRASGVFGVLATGFSVLLGFIIFLAFSSYDESRSGAESEATILTQQVETAQFLPSATASELEGELVCYARSVIGPEWDAMADGSLDSDINPWGAEMFHTMKAADPQTDAEQSAYDRWMDQNTDRQQARVDRIHGAEGIIPLPLWLALILISVVIFVYLLFFADSGEGATTQAMLMGSVTIVICLLLQLLVFFDHPHGHGVGRLQPTAMERSLRLMDAQFEVAGVKLVVPCDDRGNPS